MNVKKVLAATHQGVLKRKAKKQIRFLEVRTNVDGKKAAAAKYQSVLKRFKMRKQACFIFNNLFLCGRNKTAFAYSLLH